MPPLGPGSRFPSLTLLDEKGREASPPPGPALLGFYKTTCPTCELALPFLDRIRGRARGGELSVLGVSQDDPRASASFSRHLGIEIPTLFDPEPWRASETLGLEAVPTLFLVGPDQNIQDAVVGFRRDKMEEFAGLAARLSGRTATALFAPGENVPAFKPG